jgi:mannose-6-phosphate isomerase
LEPILLEPNQFHRFYRGGAGIAKLRGISHDDDYAPEDWVGSTTSAFGTDGVGVTRLRNGRSLPEAIHGDPEAFLGPDHLTLYGPDPGLLVKILDAGERLPVHFHPDDGFATEHLGSRYGKTEAWVIVQATPEAEVMVGFNRPVSEEELATWVAEQDVASMLEGLNRVPVRTGDSLFVPAGTPHVIGEGILMVELQQPTDFSVLLEWEGFDIDGPNEGHLGLGFDVALRAADRSAWSQEKIRGLYGGVRRVEAGIEKLLPPEADSFFTAERVRPDPVAELPAGFSIIVAIEGRGRLQAKEGAEVVLERGATVLVPFGAGECRVSGALVLLRCSPPSRP